METNQQFTTYIMNESEREYVINNIGTTNSKFHKIYKKVIYKYTNLKNYMSCRINIGVNGEARYDSSEVSTVRYHRDTNSKTASQGYFSVLVYIDEAKLDYIDKSYKERTLHIVPGTIVVFNDTTFLHRSNPYKQSGRRLLQYFGATNIIDKPFLMYVLFPKGNEHLYNLNHLLRKLGVVVDEDFYNLFIHLVEHKFGIYTTNLGNQHGCHKLNKKYKASQLDFCGTVWTKIEMQPNSDL
jgi:hypothetical protein